MNRASFRESLLQVMERKTHWAWPHFNQGHVPKELLHLHLEQEYAVYVRDFAWLLGRAYAQCPVVAVRKELAANLYEEETGGLSMGVPHADLFLRYPEGLGMDLARFADVTLGPRAQEYRDLLDELTTARGWEVAVAVTTLFLEGTPHERGELDPDVPKRPAPPLSEHPLVEHYGLPLEHLALTRVHRMVEGDHRQSAWRVVLDHIGPLRRGAVVRAMESVLASWLAYRDEVAESCGLGTDAGTRGALG
ncbi:MAG: iron-containing redox enzyme family protein [Deltaproteobacteria bacterium]|nr:iron-containing redox enzyme family protein [Deltaproteobacteria bacterium]